MTLRARYLALTLLAISIAAGVLVFCDLATLTATAVESVIADSDLCGRQIQSQLVKLLTATPPSSWYPTIAADARLKALLESSAARSTSLSQVDIADDSQIIVISSPANRAGQKLQPAPSLRDFAAKAALSQFFTTLSSRDPLVTELPLAVEGRSTPVLTVAIAVSPAQLRSLMQPGLRTLTLVSLVDLLIAASLAWWLVQMVLRPIHRISDLVEELVAAESPEPTPEAMKTQEGLDAAQELALVESKLNVLGARFRETRKDATRLRTNLGEILEKLDAGARRQVEDQIAIARRLAAINSLTRGVAHEIKNPLNSIVLRLEMLRSMIGGEDPKAQSELGILSSEVTRLDHVVRTFLDFNRPVELSFEETDVLRLVTEIPRLLEPQAALHNVSMSIHAPGSPLLIRADPSLLHQALLNIAVNAIEAMPQGGELSFGVEPSGPDCVIRIKDNGPGIPAAQLEKIFQLYYTTKPRGSGLGLAMTFRAVQLHGGSIEVSSAPGQGAEFCVKLPLLETSTASA